MNLYAEKVVQITVNISEFELSILIKQLIHAEAYLVFPKESSALVELRKHLEKHIELS